MAEVLSVWMNGVLVGFWDHSRSRAAVFRYDDHWVALPDARPLSLSMPITPGNAEHRGAVVSNYFDNLLPDSQDIRNRIRTRYKTKSTEAFDLLSAIGRDCVGAVQLLPPDATPDGWDAVDSEPLSEALVAQELRAAISDSAFGNRAKEPGGFRISIAGAQEKTALLNYAGRWHLPKGATPTTHILKLPLGLVGNRRADMRTSVPNEWLCAKILHALHIPIAKTDMATFEDQHVLVVERFDRRWQGIASGEQNGAGFKPGKKVWIARLPQEDLCQVAGAPPTAKYETDGGPGIHQTLGYLSNSANAKEDRIHFVLAQLAFWLLAATDGHAKNFSIAINRGGNYQLTPLYDVLSAWPIIGKGSNQLPIQDVKLAMALRSRSPHYALREIRVRHWQMLATQCGSNGAWERMVQLVESVEAALPAVQQLLPADFPPQVWDSVCKGMLQQAQLFLREKAAAVPLDA